LGGRGVYKWAQQETSKSAILPQYLSSVLLLLLFLVYNMMGRRRRRKSSSLAVHEPPVTYPCEYRHSA